MPRLKAITYIISVGVAIHQIFSLSKVTHPRQVSAMILDRSAVDDLKSLLQSRRFKKKRGNLQKFES